MVINKFDFYINERCVLDFYYLKNIKGFVIIVWFYGGGLIGGSKEIFEVLKNKGCVIIGVNYRLFLKVKVVKCIEDVVVVIVWVFNNIVGYGGDIFLIFVLGYFVGAYFILMIGLDKKWL